MVLSSYQDMQIRTNLFFSDCLILYKGSAEKVSTLVWEAVDDFSVVNNQKHNSKSTEYEDNFINLIGLRPGENAFPVSNLYVVKKLKIL